MDGLPFVDAHEVAVAAPRDQVWRALEAIIARNAMLGSRRGFPRREASPPERLVLAGRHRFAEYRLDFELLPAPDGTLVRATTHAAFGRGAGRIYRALVIGSRGHAFVVRRFLQKLRVTVEKRA